MSNPTKPVLLFDNECGVCRHIARWVQALANDSSGEPTLVVRPIGNDPDELRSLHSGLDIWDAYATIHILLPDGSMKVGGEAVAVVLTSIPAARWFTWTFRVELFGFRPFQAALNLAYVVLAAIRPLFGCESCGTPDPWVRLLRWPIRKLASLFSAARHHSSAPHFTPLPAIPLRPSATSQTPRPQ